MRKLITESKLSKTTNEDSVLVKTSTFPYSVYPYKKFNPVQSEALKYNTKDVNVIVSTGTGTGKTVTAELFMLPELAKGSRVVYVAPLKALTNEKLDQWGQDKAGFAPYKIEICNSDYEFDEQKLSKADVLLMTSEMLDSKSRNLNSKLLKGVSLIVVDEAHLLGVQGRGDALECAIVRLKLKKFVLLSGTIPNAVQIGAWLHKISGRECKILNTNFVPVTVNTRHYAVDDIIEETKKLIKKHKDDSFLVFVHTKTMGYAIQKEIAGSNFHHAGLNLKSRQFLEASFKEKKLRVLISTSTLAWGVNLPARRVIIVGCRRGLELVAQYDIKQMIGRAGRAGLDPMGSVYILLPERTAISDSHHCSQVPEVKSVLGDYKTLAFHFLAEVDNSSKSQLVQWYKNLLFSYQSNLDESACERNVNVLIRMLQDIDILDGLSLTEEGKLAKRFYFDPFSVAKWRDALLRFNLMSKQNAIRLAVVIASADMFKGRQVIKDRYANEDLEAIKECSSDIGMGFTEESQAFCAYLVLAVWDKVNVSRDMQPLVFLFKHELSRVMGCINAICKVHEIEAKPIKNLTKYIDK